MGDFDQTETITTLRKYDGSLEELEESLCHYSNDTSISLVLPAAYREFEGDREERPVYGIIDILKDVPPYISHVVMPLGHADESQFRAAKDAMSVLDTPGRNVDLIWIKGPRVQKILDRITKEVKSVGRGNKGQGQWLADGLVIGRGESDYVVHHDCDIYTYDREMLAKLVHPAVCPDMNFDYGTGYYPRIGRDGMMKGRLTRLLTKPLFTALKIKARQYSPNDEALNFLSFLLEHKYILSGEGFKSTDFAKTQRTTDDYDLEIVEKGEAFKKLRKKAICQKEISDSFEHHHQPLSTEDDGGLEAMSRKIVTALYDSLMSYGMDLDLGKLSVIEKMYRTIGQDFIRKYWADSISRGLAYDRSGEEETVEFLYNTLKDVKTGMFGDIGVTGDMVDTIPNWERVHSALPNIHEELIDAVHQDKRV